jgi:Tfp pilus assembly protein FimT
MAKYSRCLGFSLFEVLLGLFVFQILIFSIWPSFQAIMRDKEASLFVHDLQNSIDWVRWEAVKRQEVLYLEPIGNWKNAWAVYSKERILRQYKPFIRSNIEVVWHGFISSQRLTFYPKVYQNHCNGLFQIGHYRLWLNRLGHMRVSYAV